MFPTPYQKDLVRENFVWLVPRMERVARLFYGQLFEQMPAAGELFHEMDLDYHTHKLFQMLSVSLGLLDDPDELTQVLVDLGERHVVYGATVEQCETLGRVLVDALAEVSGPERFTPEVRAAWEVTYALLADIARSAYRDYPIP